MRMQKQDVTAGIHEKRSALRGRFMAHRIPRVSSNPVSDFITSRDAQSSSVSGLIFRQRAITARPRSLNSSPSNSTESGQIPASSATSITVSASAIKIPFSGSYFERICALVSRAYGSIRGASNDVIRTALNCDRRLGFTTFMNDPQLTGVSLKDGQKLFDDMLLAQRKYLPEKWFS